jgi:hypothetical protein
MDTFAAKNPLIRLARRVTRFGQFSPIYIFDSLLWAIFKTLKADQIFGQLFRRFRLCINFDKKWLGYISGVFFTISSGHPVCAELFTYLLTVQASLRGQVQKPFFKERSFCKVKIICSNRIG